MNANLRNVGLVTANWLHGLSCLHIHSWSYISSVHDLKFKQLELYSLVLFSAICPYFHTIMPLDGGKIMGSSPEYFKILIFFLYLCARTAAWTLIQTLIYNKNGNCGLHGQRYYYPICFTQISFNPVKPNDHEVCLIGLKVTRALSEYVYSHNGVSTIEQILQFQTIRGYSKTLRLCQNN